MTFQAKDPEIFCCPRCRGELTWQKKHATCRNCSQTFSTSGSIPRFFWPNEWDGDKQDCTDKIKAFYEETPFPDYDEFDDAGSLIEKSRRGVFARLLDDQVPFGAKILECGCGTGQLTNFLSIANRRVYGTDICLNSLTMAEEFRRQNDLGNASFLQMNLFRPAFKPGSFDLVICNGVLHHTSDPFLGFQTIADLVKPNGYILVGLYHKYGRLWTNLRQFLFRISADRLKFFDRRTTRQDISRSKRNAWFRDQYKNPHESKHTIGEVSKWLDRCGLRFIKSIPKTVPFDRFRPDEALFKPDKKSPAPIRFLVELSKTFRPTGEGGFFIVIARKTTGT